MQFLLKNSVITIKKSQAQENMEGRCSTDLIMRRYAFGRDRSLKIVYIKYLEDFETIFKEPPDNLGQIFRG